MLHTSLSLHDFFKVPYTYNNCHKLYILQYVSIFKTIMECYISLGRYNYGGAHGHYINILQRAVFLYKVHNFY